MNEKVLEGARELISGFLKDRRSDLGITQEQLAEMSGMEGKDEFAKMMRERWRRKGDEN